MRVLLFIAFFAFPFMILWAQVPTKLEGAINNKVSIEFAPAVNAEGNLMIFQSNKSPDNQWGLYSAKLNEDSSWSDLQALNLNAYAKNATFIGGPFLNYEGNKLYFTSDMEGTNGGMDIWISEWNGAEWNKPVNIGLPVNSEGYDGFPSVNKEETELYFIRHSEQTLNGSFCYNVYVSKKNEQGLWSEPEVLPSKVNKYCVGSARILFDGKTLLFSSARPDTRGGLDVYGVVKKDESEGWSDPVSILFVNTADDDEEVSVPAMGGTLYFSSGTMENDDIHYVSVPGMFGENDLIAVMGRMIDKETGESVPVTIVVSNLESDEIVAELSNNDATGDYVVLLEKGVYNLTAKPKEEGHFFFSQNLNLDTLSTPLFRTEDGEVPPLKQGEPIVIENLTFASGSEQLGANLLPILDNMIEILQLNSGLEVEISAHTDDTGDEATNQRLSERRAEAVVAYLTENGIERERLTSVGYGETQPLVPNTNEENRRRNRRVEFMVL